MRNVLEFPDAGGGNIVTDTPVFGKWIPCSKQMPIESPGVFKWDPSGSELLLITVRQNGKTRVNSTVRMNGKWFGFDEYDVIAWMPLPEPYKGG